uniref:Major facilitator superfamily (MFS) profile domain-containing protein n=1 Tax=Romanomermis culicivorax TaxID=13658 RepID=A0A915KLN4_ROMCU
MLLIHLSPHKYYNLPTVPFLPDYLQKLWYGDRCSHNSNATSHATNLYSRWNLSTSNTNCSRTGAFDGEANAEFGDDSAYIGLLLGSKAFVQLLSNPIVGPLSNRVGYTAPMFFGFVILFISTLTFAFAESYSMLMLARAIQGMASACCSTCGLGMLAQVYTDSKERGAALSIALGGLALGVLFGFPFGGFLYDLSGKTLPFFILAAVALMDAVLQLIFLPPKIGRQEIKGASLLKLLSDPYILITALGIVFACFCISMLEPTLPLWMKEAMGASPSTIALLFVPVTAAYLFGVHIFGPIAHKIGRWLLAFLGLLTCGIFDAVIFPEMGNIVDLRHVGVYGSVYSIADAAVCCAFAFEMKYAYKGCFQNKGFLNRFNNLEAFQENGL